MMDGTFPDMDAAKARAAGASKRLILAPAAPLDSAKQMLARRYRTETGRTLHHQQSTFYTWSGSHYRETDREEIRSAIWQFLDDALKLNNDQPVPFCPTRAKVADVLEALAAEVRLPGVVRAPAWLGANQHFAAAVDILACSNGLLHLPTRKLLQHTAAFFNANAVGYPYDPDASEPRGWLASLKSIWPDDQQSIDTLQEVFGLLLTSDTTHQKAILVVGPKRCGKGTIARILTAVLGQENVAGPTLNSLSTNFGLSALIGKQLAIISDARLSGRADAHIIAERLLSITGEDSLTIDRKFKAAWTGRLPTRFVILSNELPRLTDVSGALASRFIVLKLVTSFYGKEDTGLAGKLLSELLGILRWAIAGRERLVQRGYFVQPESALSAVQDLEDLASPVGAFIRERCKIGTQFQVKCDDLFTGWVVWCRGTNRDHPGTTQMFGRDLAAALPDVTTKQVRDGIDRTRYYHGITLLDQ